MLGAKDHEVGVWGPPTFRNCPERRASCRQTVRRFFFLNGQSAGLPGVPVALSELYPNPIPNIDASTGGVYRSKTQGKLIY